MAYMDDVIITSPSFNEHLDHLNQVFTLLRDAGLTLNKDKCHFARDKLKYLGLIISMKGIETDNSKVKAIAETKPPKNNKAVSKFLGMAGWYQKFISHYADICEPLYRLKKKGAKFNWSTEALEAFNKVKRALTEAPVLQLSNFQEPFNLFTDASGVGIGAVLNQKHRPIAFVSRTRNKAERNYAVTECECLVESSRQYGWITNLVPSSSRALALNSREQLIREQREDPELGHIYRYLENPDDGSVNATVCEGWSQDFKLIDDTFEYVSTCDRCQKFNYKNALAAGRLTPIVSNYPNKIVTLDLLDPYPASRPERYTLLKTIRGASKKVKKTM
ncbi:retrovirus-related Pol polyprotein from transposon 297 [Trichonephila clavipes]|nr:retrovirus-related Pol polyprotein from transposon 297 [Trichonephila clavipes]